MQFMVVILTPRDEKAEGEALKQVMGLLVGCPWSAALTGMRKTDALPRSVNHVSCLRPRRTCIDKVCTVVYTTGYTICT
jgi:hypothetical protein